MGYMFTKPTSLCPLSHSMSSHSACPSFLSLLYPPPPCFKPATPYGLADLDTINQSHLAKEKIPLPPAAIISSRRKVFSVQTVLHTGLEKNSRSLPCSIQWDIHVQVFSNQLDIFKHGLKITPSKGHRPKRELCLAESFMIHGLEWDGMELILPFSAELFSAHTHDHHFSI